MADAEKISLLKELTFYSSLLKKHEATKREMLLKTAITQQAGTIQQPNKPKSFQSYKVVKNQSHLSFNQKYSFEKPSHHSITYPKKGNGLCNLSQNFKSKYSLSKHKVSHVHDFVVKKNNLNNDVSISSVKSISNSKSDSIKKISCTSSNESEKLAYNTKDFMKEIESLTELLKKKTSSSPHRILNSKLDVKNFSHNKQLSCIKDQSNALESANLRTKTTSFFKTKGFVETQSKLPAMTNYASRVNSSMNSNIENNPMQQKVFSLNQSVYKKNNIKQSLITNSVPSLKSVKNKSLSKNGLENTISRSTSRTVIFSDCQNSSCGLPETNNVGILHKKPSEIIMKVHTPKIIFSSRKILKKSPHISKIKSPVFLKLKSSNTDKIPRIVKLKQTNTKYTKINKHLTPTNKKVLVNPIQQKTSLKKMKKKVNSKYKVINKTPTSSSRKITNGMRTSVDKRNTTLNIKHLTPPNKKVQVNPIQHKTSLKKIKKKVNSKYKVINKTPTSSSSKVTNAMYTSVDKRNTILSIDGDTFLESLNDSAVEKLEKNLLAISSELTTPHFSENNKNSSSNIIKPSVSKVNSKSAIKRTHGKKFKSGVSKYKIINSNMSQKFYIKNMHSPHMLNPVRKEKAVLIRRLFKSKNVIINKNASPTSYSAKLIKSKYLLLNKRKSSNCQKYMYPAVFQHPKFKGSYSGTTLHHRQKKFKNIIAPGCHFRLIRKASYGHQTYALNYKNNSRCMKNKLNHRYTPKNFQKTYAKLVVRTPENLNLVKAFPTSANFASRVLHRSINRILTASYKKKLSKINSYCMFYNRFGRCNRGVKCTYIHDPSKIAICTRFLRGTCKIDGCPFSHEIDPGKMAICSFFLVGQCDKENCPYRHEKLSPNAVLCKDFVQGYCCYGKECKKAHILICPKYMQGECDKGSSCTFPHPPQKAKKNIQEKEDDEETKPAEVLLEKVLRYFQQAADSQHKLEEDNPSNLFVPKQRKLEQQPSFIPLKL